MKEYYKIITHYGLEYYLKDVLTESHSNSAPYHIMCMVKNVSSMLSDLYFLKVLINR